MEHEDCDEFESGTPKGECWGDGHYTCSLCKHFRCDFVGKDGFEKRSQLTAQQGAISISTLTPNQSKTKKE